MNSEFVRVAVLGRSVGLKGYVRLHNKSDFPEQFKNGSVFFDDDKNKLVIKHYDKINSSVLFVGFESLELAKTLTNRTIYTTKEITRKSCKLKKDEFFYFDILGMKIIEDGEILGIVEDIEENASNHLFYVKTDEKLLASQNASSFYIPYIDNFVISVNLEKKEISVKNSKALLQSL